MGLPFGKLTRVEKGSVASRISKRSPSFFASRAAAIPETPAPTMTRSRTPPPPDRVSNDGSATIVCTARAPLSDENLRSGTPVRSPTT
jgi:hypothetical protein